MVKGFSKSSGHEIRNLAVKILLSAVKTLVIDVLPQIEILEYERSGEKQLESIKRWFK